MLVVCKKVPTNENVTEYFKLGGLYRVIEQEWNHFIINGEHFSNAEKEDFFDDYTKVIKQRIDRLNLFTNGKLTKKEFKEIADARIYGKQGSGLYIVYVGRSKENLFKIYPFSGTTKAKALDFAYGVINELNNGDVSSIDACRATWCCTGIGFEYGRLPNTTVYQDYQYSNKEGWAYINKSAILSNEDIADALLGDMEAYKEFVKEIIVGRLMDSSNVKTYWDAWFRGAKGKDLENAEKGKVYIEPFL